MDPDRVTEYIFEPPFKGAGSIFAAFLFCLECYHVIGHVMVMCRIRLLPRKDLKRIRYYFLIDAMTVFTTNFLYAGQLRWLAALQNIQHLFFFFTWTSGNAYTEKVISWSSLDFVHSPKTQSLWVWDVILGTFFDVMVHVINVYILSTFLSYTELLLCLAAVQGMTLLILYSTNYAWSSPYNMPQWVQKRIKPLESIQG